MSRRGPHAGSDDRRPLHPWPPRQRAALPPLAHRGELGRLPARPPPPGHVVLDVGCGPGTITADLARAVAPGPVVGIDAAAQVVAEATAMAAGADGAAGVGRTFEVGDLFDLPLRRRDASTWSTPTRCSSTWGTRWPPWSRCGGCAGPVGSWRPGTPTTRPCGTSPTIPSSTGPSPPTGALTRVNGANWDAGRRLLHWALQAGFTSVAPVGLDVVLRHPRGPGVVGRPVGRPVHPVGAWPSSCWPTASPPRGPGVVRRRLAAVGGVPRRLVRRAPRRGDLHGLTAHGVAGADDHPTARAARRSAARATRKRSGASTIG